MESNEGYFEHDNDNQKNSDMGIYQNSFDMRPLLANRHSLLKSSFFDEEGYDNTGPNIAGRVSLLTLQQAMTSTKRRLSLKFMSDE